jgi:hypothetical protein
MLGYDSKKEEGLQDAIGTVRCKLIERFKGYLGEA